MVKLKRYLKILLGSFIIGCTLNLFFMSYDLIPAGIFGFGVIYSLKAALTLPLSILFGTLLFLIMGVLTLPWKIIKKMLLPTTLIILFSFLTKDIIYLIDISSADRILTTIFGGSLLGLGSRFIYKEEHLVGAGDIMEHIAIAIFGPNGRNVNIIADIILLIFTIINFGLESAMYSSIAMLIIEFMNRKSIIGISDTKVFYIITKEENQVKKFIMNELHCDLTIYDVKGGFSKSKNRVLMSAIDTKDYYKLRERIKEIDPDAFITITDSYEVVNPNAMLNL